MTRVAEYKKLIAAFVGIAVILLRTYTGLDLGPMSGVLIDAVVAVGTLIFVERLSNKPSASR